ncbi:MAG: D-alanine--poly(phosphoribitol) ligase subunit DltC [Clostridiales Family XIII bacterium]|nr:D-alanine--poly(phosphoribitol) ligase subunit DltC [Clostridiales Family XIII bacterium]
METKENILDILAEITGTSEVRENLDVDLFAEGLLDSIGTVQLLLDLEAYCKVSIPVTEFDRAQWTTPKQIIEQVEQRIS